MCSAKHNRGNVILLVVGVLAVLAMVGTAFLMFAWAGKKEAVAIGESAAMRPIANGQLQRVLAELVRDLYIHTDNAGYSYGPYSQDLGADNWKVGIDYPSPDPAYADQANPDHGFDMFLAGTETAWADGANGLQLGRWTRVSNLGDLREGTWGPNPGDAKTLNVPVDAPDMVDTDGDGTNDAMLFATGVSDARGQRYYAAVRIVDACGKVNLTTSNGPRVPTSIVPRMPRGMNSPDDIPPNLVGATGRLDISNIHPFRINRLSLLPPTSQGEDDWLRFIHDVSIRPENPRGTIGQRPTYDYCLFDPADALACYWLNPAASVMNPTLATGRLASAVGGEFRQYRARLTPFSGVRCILRRSENWTANNWLPPAPYPNPVPAASVNRSNLCKMDPNRAWWNTSINTDPLSGANKQQYFDGLRRQFYAMIPPGVPGISNDERQRRITACQLAVNLIDFRDSGDNDQVSVADVPGENVFVYGMERQPFITQAWYKIVKDAANVVQTRLMAVVLRNPYPEAISLQGWTLRNSSGNQQALSVSLAPFNTPGDRVVIRSSSDVNVDAGILAANTVLWANLDPEKDFRILRPGAYITPPSAAYPYYRPSPAATALLQCGVVGLIRPADFDIAPSVSPLAVQASESKYGEIKREDSPFRMSVAVYDPDVNLDYDRNAGNDAIGANTGSTMAGRVAPTPVYVRAYLTTTNQTLPTNSRVASLVSLADMSRLFYVGPTSSLPLDVVLAGSDPNHPELKANDVGNGRLNSFGFSPIAGNSHPKLPVFCQLSDYFMIDSPLLDYQVAGGQHVDNDGDTDANNVLPVNPSANERLSWYKEQTIHGAININTASAAAMSSIPMATPAGAAGDAQRWQIVTELISYRDLLETSLTTNYRTARTPGGATAANLRQEAGFATAGELAIPLRKMADADELPDIDTYGPLYSVSNRGSDDGYAPAQLTGVSDLVRRELRYAYASNQITVNSDMFVVYIRVQMNELGNNDLTNPDIKRHYVALVDRTNVYRNSDMPIVRMFAEVK